MITFDGPNKIASLSLGTTTLNVVDLWSRWTDWMALSDNSKYLPMFTSTGGDVIDPSAGTAIPSYVFVENGWRIKPQEADHTLNVTGGVLVVGGGGDPFTNTNGAFQIRINYSQPVQAIAVAGSGSAPDASTVADAVWTHSFVSKILTVAKFLGLRSS